MSCFCLRPKIACNAFVSITLMGFISQSLKVTYDVSVRKTFFELTCRSLKVTRHLLVHMERFLSFYRPGNSQSLKINDVAVTESSELQKFW